MLIELIDVGFTYMPNTPLAQTALIDINLAIRDGEFIGLVGPTGSGKSTLIQHLNGLLIPTTGKVLFRGQEIGRSMHSHLIRKEVGLVFQFPEGQLFEETVEKDIAFGPRNLGLADKEVFLRVEESLGQVGLDYSQFAGRSPFSLSGGEMRLVAIAGVLAMRPRVLVLDEPTSGLDAHGKKAVLDCLDRLNKDGVTIVMVTHSMDEVADSAGRIVTLSEGKIVLDDIPERVFAQSEFLSSIGLDIPKTVEVLMKLRSRGLDVAADVADLPSAVSAILAAIKEKKR